MKLSKKKIEAARRIHTKRPKHAQRIDKSELSRITTSVDVYKTDKTRWDFPFVDTPKFWNNMMKNKRAY